MRSVRSARSRVLWLKRTGPCGGPGGPWARAMSAAAGNVEVAGGARSNPHSLLVTCEHAGNALPAGAAWSAADLARGLPGQHWAYDPGARDCECGMRGGQGRACVLLMLGLC